MKRACSAVSLSKGDFLCYLALPIIVTLYLLFSRDYTFLQRIVRLATEFLQSLPLGLVPIVAPAALLGVFLGFPIVAGLIFPPKYCRLLFSSMSLAFAILLLNLMRMYINVLTFNQ